MATILQLPGFRPARQKYGLTLTQAASALGITPSVLDAWERGGDAQIDPAMAAAAFEKYAENTEALRTSGKNLLFGCFPMRVARDLLQLEIKQIAAEFGYSPSYWSKIEANARAAPPEIIEQIESRIRDTMGELCGFG
jgi:transcriptional regulator with XRE-family HTH domain